MSEDKIIFYSYHECDKSPNKDDCIKFKQNNINIIFPCVVLMRLNNWNDFSYFTHFYAFYLPEPNEITELGEVLIIQSKAEEGYTKLPTEFEELPKKQFFSRGRLSFYNTLKMNERFKDQILFALNDIHFHHYSKTDICKIDNELEGPYDNSLFRQDLYEFEISSRYARDSLDMLDKITFCVESLSKLDATNQKIIIKLLYGSVITTLECYLGDAFKYHVINNKGYFGSFLTNYDFPKGAKKYSWKELGVHGNRIQEFIENKVKSTMDDISFHNLKVANGLYKTILNIDLPTIWKDFDEAIQKRHDIFHRNGKNIASIDFEIQPNEIKSLIKLVKTFITEMERIISAQT